MEKQVQAMQQRVAEAEASSEQYKAAAVEAEADLLTAQEDTVAQVAAITRRLVLVKPDFLAHMLVSSDPYPTLNAFSCFVQPKLGPKLGS